MHQYPSNLKNSYLAFGGTSSMLLDSLTFVLGGHYSLFHFYLSKQLFMCLKTGIIFYLALSLSRQIIQSFPDGQEPSLLHACAVTSGRCGSLPLGGTTLSRSFWQQRGCLTSRGDGTQPAALLYPWAGRVPGGRYPLSLDGISCTVELRNNA